MIAKFSMRSKCDEKGKYEEGNKYCFICSGICLENHLCNPVNNYTLYIDNQKFRPIKNANSLNGNKDFRLYIIYIYLMEMNFAGLKTSLPIQKPCIYLPR